MSTSVRAYIKAEIQPLLPGVWQWIDEQRTPETLAHPIVVTKHTRIMRLPAAPIGHLLHTVTLSVFDPSTDIAKAENNLDDHVADMLTALDAHTGIRFESAEKVLHPSGKYLGWDIRLTVIASSNTQEV